MKILVLGSMAFLDKIEEIKKQLGEQGHEARSPVDIMPENIEIYKRGITPEEIRVERKDNALIKRYFEEIKNVDAMLEVNEEKKGVKGYVGGNSLIEMAFTYVLGKKLFLLNQIPELSYKDEIEAMQPIIINGDLSLIK